MTYGGRLDHGINSTSPHRRYTYSTYYTFGTHLTSHHGRYQEWLSSPACLYSIHIYTRSFGRRAFDFRSNRLRFVVRLQYSHQLFVLLRSTTKFQRNESCTFKASLVISGQTKRVARFPRIIRSEGTPR